MANRFPTDALAEFDPEVRGEALPEREDRKPSGSLEMPPPVSTAPGAVRMGGVDGWPEGDVLEFAAESPEERGETEEVAVTQYRLSIPFFHDRKIAKQTLADYGVSPDSYDWEGQEIFTTSDETIYELVKDALPQGGYREVSDEQMGANVPDGNETPHSVRPATVNQLHRNYEAEEGQNEKLTLKWSGLSGEEGKIGSFVVSRQDSDRLQWAFNGEIAFDILDVTDEPATSYDDVVAAIKNTPYGKSFSEAAEGWGKYHDKDDSEIESTFNDLLSSTGMHDYKFPATADEWGLYAEKPGADEAAKKLAARVKSSVTEIWTELKYANQMGKKMSAQKLRKIMERVFQTLQDRYLSQGKFKEFGADDTVVREKIWEVINDLTPAFIKKVEDDDDKDGKKPEKDNKGLLLGKAEPDSEEELAMGVKVEMEHADTIKRIQSGELTDIKDIATAIAQDHLKEMPDYYTRLKAMEAGGKAAKGSEEKSEAEGRTPKPGEIYDTPSYGKVVVTAVQDGKVFADMIGVTGDKSVLHEYPLALWQEMNPKFVGMEEPGDINRQTEGAAIFRPVLFEGPGVSLRRRYDIKYNLLKRYQYKLWKAGVESEYRNMELIGTKDGKEFRIWTTSVGPASNGEMAFWPVMSYDGKTYGAKLADSSDTGFNAGFQMLLGQPPLAGAQTLSSPREVIPASESQPDRIRDAGSSPQGGHDPETVVKTEFTDEDDPDKLVKTQYTAKDDKAKKGEKKEDAYGATFDRDDKVSLKFDQDSVVDHKWYPAGTTGTVDMVGINFSRIKLDAGGYASFPNPALSRVSAAAAENAGCPFGCKNGLVDVALNPRNPKETMTVRCPHCAPPLSEAVDKSKCPACGGERVMGCRCPNRIIHTLEDVKMGHGAECANGHRWTYQTEDGKPIVITVQRGAKGLAHAVKGLREALGAK